MALLKSQLQKLKEVVPDDISIIPHQNEIIPARIVDIHDGDTCTVIILYGSIIPMKLKIRLANIDTPEVTTGSELQKQSGKYVTTIISSLLLNKIVPLKIIDSGCYDRMLGEIYLDNRYDKTVKTFKKYKTWSEFMIGNGFCKPYDGKTKRELWTDDDCQEILEKCEKYKL